MIYETNLDGDTYIIDLSKIFCIRYFEQSSNITYAYIDANIASMCITLEKEEMPKFKNLINAWKQYKRDSING